MQINLITGEIIDASIKVHRHLGPGLLESAYEAVTVAEVTGDRDRAAGSSCLHASLEC